MKRNKNKVQSPKERLKESELLCARYAQENVKSNVADIRNTREAICFERGKILGHEDDLSWFRWRLKDLQHRFRCGTNIDGILCDADSIHYTSYHINKIIDELLRECEVEEGRKA